MSAVTSAAGLIAALASGAREIVVGAALAGLPPLRLEPGQALVGASPGTRLGFAGRGLALAGDNRLENLAIACPPTARAIHLDAPPHGAGRFQVRSCQVQGLVHFLFEEMAGDVELELVDLAITAAEANALLPRPTGNGVEVLQGALTIWNRAPQAARLYLTGQGITIGTRESPVRGTGLFIAGGAPGSVALRRLETGPVHSDSGLPEGTTGTVAGGIFLLAGVRGERVVTHGDIVTHGANAVPVDNWGELALWQVHGSARSFGPSAVGLVNAGRLGRCAIDGDIETHGDGARGCCIYGPTGQVRARAIRTFGKAAVGLQVVDRLEVIDLVQGIYTQGDPGEGLMKGTMVTIAAHGIDIEPGAWLGRIDCPEIRALGQGAQAIRRDGAAPEPSSARPAPHSPGS